MDGAGLERWLRPDEAVDLTNCDREPIHAPSTIQPHGVLMVFDGEGALVQRSANLESYCGAGWRDLAAQAWEAARHIPERDAEDFDVNGVAHVLVAHRIDAQLIVELEPRGGVAPASILSKVNRTIARLELLDAESGLEAAARAVQELTGYHRVMVYRFAPEGHGTVTCEVVREGEPRFLGLRFPASDIPKQARRLYVLERVRQIADVSAEPVPLEPVQNPVSGRVLNMALCGLRSVSPIHVQYLRNMGVGASFSVSVVVEGHLEALFACHDDRPNVVSVDVRQACDLIGRAVGQKLTQALFEEQQASRSRVVAAQIDLMSELAANSQLDVDIAAWDKAQGFVPCDALLVRRGTRVRVFGEPSESFDLDAVSRAAKRMAHEAQDGEPQMSDRVGTYDEHAVGGLLVVPIPGEGWVAWYRLPRDQVVHWGGEPDPSRARKSLEPRASFAAWQQVVKGSSEPWSHADLEVAEVMRRGLMVRFGDGVDPSADGFEATLRQLREYVFYLEHAHQTQVRISEDLRQFAHAASHDLRAPLRTIRSFLPLIESDVEGALSDDGKQWVRFVESAAETLGRLQEGLWAFSKVSRERDFEPARLAVMVRRIREGLAADLGDAVVTVGELPTVLCVPGQVETLFRNLLHNAAKYRDEGRQLRITISVQERAGEQVFTVSDNGIGFPPDEVERAFHLFSRLHPERSGGDGIGLALCRRIVHHHGGWIRAVAERQGATIEFTLPGPGSSP